MQGIYRNPNTAHPSYLCQVAYHAINCSETVGVEGHSLDGSDLRCDLVVQRGIKDVNLASGLFDDILLKGRLPVRSASTSPHSLDNLQHAM